MARLTAEQWAEARADYEVRLLSLRQIAEKFDVHASSVSDKCKKEQWDREKTQQLIEKNFLAVKELEQITQQTRQKPKQTQQAIKEAVDIRLKIAEGDECSAKIYALTRKRGLKIAQQNGDLNELMRLMTVGNEAVKTTVKMIEINDKQPEIIESDQPKTLKLEVVRVEN